MVWQERGMDFADAFHLANSQACHQFLTFDQKMAEVASTVQSKCLVLSADCDG
jgi:predicted nucleic acid-binding protein